MTAVKSPTYARPPPPPPQRLNIDRCIKPSIEDITLTYKLISLKQLDNSWGKHKSLHVTKSPTTIRQFTSVYLIQSAELPAKVAKTQLNKSFRYIYLPVIPLNTQNTFDFSRWSCEIMRLFRRLARLHISTREVL